MMQQCDDVFGMYVGNAAEGQADVTFYITVAATIATGILRLTKVGRNWIEIAEYYFVRSLTHFEDRVQRSRYLSHDVPQGLTQAPWHLFGERRIESF
jgi:hypothetical protein